MSLRPEGTDGSDHVYREVVEKAYTIRARTRKWSNMLMYASIFPGVVRALYFIVGGNVGGLTADYHAMAVVALHTLAIMAWMTAKVGTSKESFLWVRVAASFSLCWFALFVTSAYKYQFMTSRELHINTRLALYLRDSHGIAGEHIWGILHQIDAAVDCAVFIAGCLLFGQLHPFVMVQINLRKRAEEAAAASGASAGSETRAPKAIQSPEAAAAASKGGAVKRRPGRA